jgi:hypothetical protein
VTAEVEAIAVALDGLGEAADLLLGLQDDHRNRLLGEPVGGRQARRTRAEDENRVTARSWHDYLVLAARRAGVPANGS